MSDPQQRLRELIDACIGSVACDGSTANVCAARLKNAVDELLRDPAPEAARSEGQRETNLDLWGVFMGDDFLFALGTQQQADDYVKMTRPLSAPLSVRRLRSALPVGEEQEKKA